LETYSTHNESGLKIPLGICEAREYFILKQNQRLPGEKILLLMMVFISLITTDVLKESSPCRSYTWWGMVLGPLGIFYLVNRMTVFMLIDEEALRTDLGLESDDGDIVWSPDNIRLFSLYSCLAGIIAGMFGIGGSVVNSWLLLGVGKVSPGVSAASCATMTLFTAGAACSVYVSFGILQMSLGASMVLLGFLCTLLGQISMNRVIKKLNRQSLVVLTMSIVIMASLVLLFIRTVAVFFELFRNPRELLQFQQICVMKKT
jgi:uncharacterized membrane protein YfcA